MHRLQWLPITLSGQYPKPSPWSHLAISQIFFTATHVILVFCTCCILYQERFFLQVTRRLTLIFHSGLYSDHHLLEKPSLNTILCFLFSLQFFFFFFFFSIAFFHYWIYIIYLDIYLFSVSSSKIQIPWGLELQLFDHCQNKLCILRA